MDFDKRVQRRISRFKAGIDAFGNKVQEEWGKNPGKPAFAYRQTPPAGGITPPVQPTGIVPQAGMAPVVSAATVAPVVSSVSTPAVKQQAPAVPLIAPASSTPPPGNTAPVRSASTPSAAPSGSAAGLLDWAANERKANAPMPAPNALEQNLERSVMANAAPAANSGGYMNGQQVASKLAEMNKSKGMFPDRPTSEMEPGTFRASGPAGNISGRVNMPNPEDISKLDSEIARQEKYLKDAGGMAQYGEPLQKGEADIVRRNIADDRAKRSGMLSQQTDLGPMLNPKNRAPEGMRSGIIGQVPESPKAFFERNKYQLMPGSDTNRMAMRRQDDAAKATADAVRQRQEYGLAQERILGDATTAKAKAEAEGMLGVQGMKNEAEKQKSAAEIEKAKNTGLYAAQLKPEPQQKRDFSKEMTSISDMIGDIQTDPEWQKDPAKAAQVAKYQSALDKIMLDMGAAAPVPKTSKEGGRVRGPDGKTYVIKNGVPVLVAA